MQMPKNVFWLAEPSSLQLLVEATAWVTSVYQTDHNQEVLDCARYFDYFFESLLDERLAWRRHGKSEFAASPESEEYF